YVYITFRLVFVHTLLFSRYLSLSVCRFYSSFFFFNDTATTEIYTLSLHDALPIYVQAQPVTAAPYSILVWRKTLPSSDALRVRRSEEHTSELQSRENLVCRLLLEKKKKKKINKNRQNEQKTEIIVLKLKSIVTREL